MARSFRATRTVSKLRNLRAYKRPPLSNLEQEISEYLVY
jgi:hypothetical protein